MLKVKFMERKRYMDLETINSIYTENSYNISPGT